MKASRELLTTGAIQHEEAMKKILYDKDEPRRQELNNMSFTKLKSLAKHYTENSSHSFNLRSIRTKNKLIEKLIAFENSIDTNPDLQFWNKAGKKTENTRENADEHADKNADKNALKNIDKQKKHAIV